MQVVDPPFIAAGLAAARMHFERNDTAAAEQELRSLLARAPASEDAAMLLAQVLQSQGRLTAASDVLLSACRANDFASELSLRCALFVRQCDRHVIAAQICAGALARAPKSPGLLMMAGNVARETGDFEIARSHYLSALADGVDLEQHQVFGALANTKRYGDPADPDLARFARHFSDGRYSARSRASAGFALAKAKADLGDYAAAAASLRTANAMVRAVQPWSIADWHASVHARMHETVVPADGAPKMGCVPVFIVGVPRSGTTLTASLLARASGARDRGELRALRFIAERLVRGAHLGSAPALAEARALYHGLAVQDDAPANYYIDQDPLNFRYLHIAASMFPNAKVIHVRRDVHDTAMSLWSQDFAHPDLAFAYAFDDMQAFMAGEVALVQHWQRTELIPICELRYEALVSEPARELTRLCDFIGAPPPAEYAGESAPVQSASVWQARQPVYTSSIGRWRHFVPYVPELAQLATVDSPPRGNETP